MQSEVTIPWPENLEEFVFASKTSLVNQRKHLIHELKHAGKINRKYYNHVEKHHVNQHEKHGADMKIEYQHKMDLIICNEHNKIDVKRVVVEAIDINWVFHGDNMKMLIILLKRE
jgi:hypothetical protein